ncbi:MAG: YIP1 family protein, partial [Oscillospiraceae bacterium]|nr:YIP1 family protein [Oscillospiraceae bacterium]
SPHAYVPAGRYNGNDFNAGALRDPAALVTGLDGNLYIADTGMNRILMLSPEMTVLNEITVFPNAANIDRKLADLYKIPEPPEEPEEDEEEFEEGEEPEATKAPVKDPEAEPGTDEPEEEPEEFDPRSKIQIILEEMLEQELLDEEQFQYYMDNPRGYYNDWLASTPDDPAIDGLNAPEGIFVLEDSTFYIADTGNNRVVILRILEDGRKEMVQEIREIESDILDEDFEWRPRQVVVDSSRRIFVNVKNNNKGIAELSADGQFVGFYGAQKAPGGVLSWFTDLFMTEEQLASRVRIIPRVYNNMAVDGRDFIWLTANSMNPYDLWRYMSNPSSDNAPIKRMNPNGEDVLIRKGSSGLAPGGDYDMWGYFISSIVAVAVKPDSTGIYTLVDAERQKLFTYDNQGNLLYAFGGEGGQNGVFSMLADATYFNGDLLILDKGNGTISRFTRTDYGALLEEALQADAERDFDKSLACWKEIHKQNSNFEQAYIGIAKAHMRNQDYTEAMKYYKEARNKEGYSKAFKFNRSEIVRDNIAWVLLVVVLIGVALRYASRYIHKVNAVEHVTGTPTTLKQELFYGMRVIFHPIAGFWEIKREKRGSLRAAFVLLGLACISFCYQATGPAYLFNLAGIQTVRLSSQVINMVVPVLLWCVASWSLTTLMSGEGSFKDIFIATCYALIPLILILVPVTIATNFLSLDEEAFINFFKSLAYGWMAFLIIFGSMVTQDYHFSKNMITVILSVVGMGIIMFLTLLLFSLTGKITGFFTGIYDELIYRL